MSAKLDTFEELDFAFHKLFQRQGRMQTNTIPFYAHQWAYMASRAHARIVLLAVQVCGPTNTPTISS